MNWTRLIILRKIVYGYWKYKDDSNKNILIETIQFIKDLIDQYLS